MGIAVQELLANEFFKDFEVVAGRKGLYKEMQGILFLRHRTPLNGLRVRKWYCLQDMLLNKILDV